MTAESAKTRRVNNSPYRAAVHEALNGRDPKVWWEDLAVIKGYPKSSEAWLRIHGVEQNSHLQATRVTVAPWSKDRHFDRTGTPDGWKGKEAFAARAAGQEEAKELVAVMVEKELLDPDDKLANEALGYFVGVMRSGTDAKKPYSAKEVAQAAMTILQYTKGKPATKVEASVSKAEDFLAALVPHMKD